MASKVQIRRGTTSDANAFAGGEGELYMDLDQNDLRIHNGTTLGGFRIPNVNYVNEVASTKVDKIQLSSGGTVGSGSEIPVITYNEQGQITVASSVAVNIPANIATESYVQTQISNLVNAAPSQLNTLSELALALNNDSNFATTVTNAIAAKQNALVSGTNIKTVNNNSLLGSGNIQISAGGLRGMIAFYTPRAGQTNMPYSGTWTVPTDVTVIKVTLTSGGGGAGKSSGGAFSGGGSGASVIVYLSVTPGQTVTWSRGVGGIAATTSGTSGSSGGQSSISLPNNSNIAYATGGTGGGTFFGGSGGQPIISVNNPLVLGHMSVSGQPGASSSNTVNEYGAVFGAATIWGGGSVFYKNEGSAAGSDSFVPRHGVGGASNNGSGFNGGDGIVMIEY